VPVKVSGRNGMWNIDPNPIDSHTKNNFKVSLKNGVWLYNSFNSDEGGTIIDFLKEKERLSDEQIMDKLNYLLGNNELLEVPKIVSEKLHSQKDINKLIEKIDTTEIEYFKHRGISEEVIKKYKLGISENGIADMYSILGMKSHPKMRDHKNIIPCFDEYNNLKFIVARNSKDTLFDGDKKTWNIKGISTYFYKSILHRGF
jgi:DNA primase